MSMQYRITVNGQSSGVLDAYPGERWNAAAPTYEERGLCATLERRLITDADMLDLVEDTRGYIRIGDQVACPWEILASFAPCGGG